MRALASFYYGSLWLHKNLVTQLLSLVWRVGDTNRATQG